MTIKENETLSGIERANILPQGFHPWRRFLARSFDLSIYSILWAAFLAFIFHVNLATRSAWGNLLDSLITLAITLI